MNYDIHNFDKLVDLGYLRRVDNNELVLFNYTDKCVYERAWNEYTMISRGLILHKNTGEVVAFPIKKFFNFGENERVSFNNLPSEPYKVFEKVDGSLGILYFYQDQWLVATRGSFNSTQAIKGLDILNAKYTTEFLDTNTTYLAEIIYPENKIVVDYNGEEKLVMLAAYETDTGFELPFEEVKRYAQMSKMPYAKEYSYTIQEMVELQKSLPKDQEGFVVRFESGLRVKIKGEEYLRIHKMISNMSPLSFWESMKDGKVPTKYLAQLPEEFRKDFEPMVQKLERQYTTVKSEIQKDISLLPNVDLSSKDGKKVLGLLVQSKNHGLKHPSAMFPVVLNQNDALEKYIMKTIRPLANNLLGIV